MVQFGSLVKGIQNFGEECMFNFICFQFIRKLFQYKKKLISKTVYFSTSRQDTKFCLSRSTGGKVENVRYISLHFYDVTGGFSRVAKFDINKYPKMNNSVKFDAFISVM